MTIRKETIGDRDGELGEMRDSVSLAVESFLMEQELGPMLEDLHSLLPMDLVEMMLNR